MSVPQPSRSPPFWRSAATCALASRPKRWRHRSRREWLSRVRHGINAPMAAPCLPATRQTGHRAHSCSCFAPAGLSTSASCKSTRNLAAGPQRRGRLRPLPQRRCWCPRVDRFSGYNTGNPQRGFENGYVARILAAGASNAAQGLAPAAAPLPDPPQPRPFALSLGRTVPGRTLTYGR